MVQTGNSLFFPVRPMSSDPSLSLSGCKIQMAAAAMERRGHLSLLFLLQYMYFSSSSTGGGVVCLFVLTLALEEVSLIQEGELQGMWRVQLTSSRTCHVP